MQDKNHLQAKETTQQNESGPLPHTRYKNQLKMYQGSNRKN